MKNILLFVLLGGLLSACAGALPSSRGRPTPIGLPSRTPPAPTPTATLVPLPTATLPDTDTGWRPVDDGLAVRDIDVVVQKVRVDHLFLVRLDPAFYRFEVAYDPLHPKSIADWLTGLGARVVFNGGYFQVEGQRYLPAGLLVVEGQVYGQSYSGYGGMFAVSAAGAQLRGLVQQPYRPGEALEYALQSFPLLVKPGGVMGFPAHLEDHMLARRTVLARDRSGRFIVMVSTSDYFTLHRLSAYLVYSGLDLDIALNLDGGPSSGIALSEPPFSLPAVSELPIVIAAFPR